MSATYIDLGSQVQEELHIVLEEENMHHLDQCTQWAEIVEIEVVFVVEIVAVVEEVEFVEIPFVEGFDKRGI